MSSDPERLDVGGLDPLREVRALDILASIRPVLDASLLAIDQQWRDDVRKITAAFEEQSRRFREQLANTFRETDAAIGRMIPDALALGQRGWTVPSWGPLQLTSIIVHRVPPDQTDEFFVRSYQKRLRERERTLFKEVVNESAWIQWQPLLRQAIRAYRRRDYLIVIPALFSVFEGVLALAAGTSRKRTQPRPAAKSKADGARSALVRLAWESLHSFTATVFADRSFADTPPDRINRHWVLHGRAAPEWGKADCLRLFQAVDTVRFIKDT